MKAEEQLELIVGDLEDAIKHLRDAQKELTTKGGCNIEKIEKLVRAVGHTMEHNSNMLLNFRG